MKKLYLTAGLLSLFSISIHAQTAVTSAPEPITSFATVPVDAPPSNTEIVPKIGGELIWSNDFSNPSDWTINNSGQFGASYGWDIGPTLSSWYLTSVINSVSGGNFAELNNGNPSSGNPPPASYVTYTISTASPVTIPTRFLELSFSQYGARFNEAQEMYISTNGSTWIKVGDNSDIPALTSTSGSAYPNPSPKSINLASFIPGGTPQIWIRFSWTTSTPLQASNPNAWVTYGWLIDDVKLTELYQNDLKINNVVWGVADGSEIIPYYKTPVNQIQPIKFGGGITNDGTVNKTDVVFKTNITAAGYAGQSATSVINVSQTDTIFATNNFTPPATQGSYTANGFTVQTAVDDFTANNSLSSTINFEVTNNVYARDKGVVDGRGNNSSQGFQFCNYFYLYANQPVSGIDVFIHQLSSTNAPINVSIRDDADFNNILAVSQSFSLSSSNLNSFVSVPFSSAYNLTTGAYLACAGSNSPNIVIGTSGYSQEQSSFVYLNNEDAWYYTNYTPMVRMRMGASCTPSFSNNPRTICTGGSYTINGHTYTAAGTYTDVMQSVHGCDSTVTTILSVIQGYSVNNPRTICAGGSYTINGHTYTAAGTYTDVLHTAGGCDSTVTTILSVIQGYTVNNPRTICAGGSYTINGHTYTAAGTYTDVLHTSGGCDSTVTTILSVIQGYSVNNPRTICAGQSYSINGHTYTAPGTYTDILHSVNGCDSTVTTVLTVNPSYSANNPQSICNGGSYSINGHTYTAAGTYTDVLHASNGCDSIVTTTITIGTPTLNTAASISGITLTSLENNATYQWVDCNNNNVYIGGATSQSFTPTSNGSYAVILTSTTNCPGATVTSPCYNISHVGIEAIDKMNGIRLYPNPAREEIFITSENTEMKHIRLTDVNGKQFHEQQFSGKETQINVKYLSQGIYLLEIETESGTSVQRFVKE